MSAKLNRKAYIFSGTSGLLLGAFAVMYQLGVSPFEQWVSYLILGILLVATVLPLTTRGWCEENAKEESFSNFADLTPPATSSFTFEVPSLPDYKKWQTIPARLASALAGLMLLLLFGGGTIIGNMLQSNIPFAAFSVAAAGFILLSLTLIVLFVMATSRELRFRQAFYEEVIAGVAAEGYEPIRTFNPEVVDDRRVLLTDGHDYYSWWDLSFDGTTAKAEWADTRQIAKKKDEGTTGMMPAIIG